MYVRLAALNFAATLECPVVFVCRNNGFAISTPVKDQYRGDGIAARGIAYGMHTIRVDGMDMWAVLEATRRARAIAVGEDGTGKTKPVLIEAMTYREGHHSTSDDSTRYRAAEEIQEWRAKYNPVRRLRAYLELQGWWNAEMETAAMAEERKGVLTALATAERKGSPDLKVCCIRMHSSVCTRHILVYNMHARWVCACVCGDTAMQELVNDVYDVIPPHLQSQWDALQEHVAKYPDHYTPSH